MTNRGSGQNWELKVRTIIVSEIFPEKTVSKAICVNLKYLYKPFLGIFLDDKLTTVRQLDI